MTDYDAVLFDSDGVLVEPPALQSQLDATWAAFREVGLERPSEQHLLDVVNGVTVDGLADVCTAYDLDAEVFWEARERHDEQSQFDAFEAGHRERYDDVTAIADHPSPRGVVSNNHHSTIAFKLDFFDLEPLFDTFHGREMTVESLTLKKPNTHYLDRAMADFDADAALYVGDSGSDVAAADRAGLDSVFIRQSHNHDADLSTTPTYEVESLDDVTSIVS